MRNSISTWKKTIRIPGFFTSSTDNISNELLSSFTQQLHGREVLPPLLELGGLILQIFAWLDFIRYTQAGERSQQLFSHFVPLFLKVISHLATVSYIKRQRWIPVLLHLVSDKCSYQSGRSCVLLSAGELVQQQMQLTGALTGCFLGVSRQVVNRYHRKKDWSRTSSSRLIQTALL